MVRVRVRVRVRVGGRVRVRVGLGRRRGHLLVFLRRVLRSGLGLAVRARVKG